MRTFVGKISIVIVALFAACSSGSTGPEPKTTYELQVTTAPPASATINATVPIAFIILQRTDNGPTSPASNRTITFTVTGGGGTINNANAVTMTTGADGAISLSWKLGGTPGIQTLQATATGITPVDLSITATALPASQLAIITQPATQVVAGVVLSRQPVLQLRNAVNAVVAQSGVAVVASVASGTATLGGTTTVITDANGNATFAGLSLSGTGTVTLRFTATLNGQSTAVTSEATVVIPPNQLALTMPVTGLVSGFPFFQQPVIQLQDGLGAPIRQAGIVVTVSTSAATATLGIAEGGSGASTATTDANGVATFHDLMLTGTGSATVSFAAPGFTSASSASFALAPQFFLSIGNGVPTNAMSGTTGTLYYYVFNASVNSNTLSFATYDGTGNVELYARRGAWPTATDFTCHDQAAGNSHLCDIAANRDGLWYVIVRGTSTFEGTRARGFAYGASCAQRVLTLGVPLSGTLTAGVCPVNGLLRAMDRFALTLATPQAVRINITGNNAVVVTYKRLSDSRVFFTMSPGNTTAVLLLAPGTYEVEVQDAAFGVPVAPTYTITISALVPPAPVGCGTMLGSSGLSLSLTLTAGDCAGTTAGTRSHRITVLLGPGQTVTATAASSAFDPYLKVMPGQITGTVATVAEDDNSGGGTSARVSYTNPGVQAFFTIEVAPKTGAALGDYAFTLNIGGSFYNSRTLEVVKQ